MTETHVPKHRNRSPTGDRPNSVRFLFIRRVVIVRDGGRYEVTPPDPALEVELVLDPDHSDVVVHPVYVVKLFPVVVVV